MKHILKITTLLFAIAGLSCFSGCNTMQGVGEDMQAAGDEIEEEAS